jgi:hypothetical protein
MKKIVFVSDFFIQDGIGGAELTTDAIMRYGASKINTFDIGAIRTTKLDTKIIDANKEDSYFIVCNFKGLSDESKIHMCKNASYSIIEYDYKVCEYRSFELHEMYENNSCDCETKISGKITSAFYGYADKIWFMSKKQKDMILAKVPAIKQENCEVLSSVFSAGDLRFIYSLRENEKDNKYLILDSESPVKGTSECVNYAQQNNLEYELISNLPYYELLIKLSTSKGLIFMPVASDTCPRLVIEAKMLGCDLILNEHVQHKDEDWFYSQKSCYKHMDSRPDAFWSHYEQ